MSSLSRQNPFGSFKASLFASLLVIIFLIWLIYIQKPDPTSTVPQWILYLPSINAIANALSAIFLVRAIVAIKKGMKEVHKKNIWIAVGFSTIFLVGYVTFYTFHGDRKFLGEGAIRFFYLGILLSHILISIVSLPAILFSLSLGIQERWDLHKVWAKRTFPMWLYVNVTGVLIHILFSIFSKT